MTAFEVEADQAGTRIDVTVAAVVGCSRSQAAARIEAGQVLVDGATVAKRHRLRVGERVEVRDPDPATRAPAPPLPPVRYEDEHLLVVAKPVGLVVHPGHGHPSGTLVDALEAAGIPLAAAGGEGRPGIVHRLDRDTSGLMVVAKTDLAYHGLVAALRERTVERRYLALVQGRPGDDRGWIDGPIGRDPRDRTRFAVVADGKPARTRYRLLSAGRVESGDDEVEVSLLACELATGRTHQVRVHLSTLGHPLVGDPVYRGSRRLADVLGLQRPGLHAAHVAFAHPVAGQRVVIDEPLPDDLVTALTRAGISPPGPDLR